MKLIGQILFFIKLYIDSRVVAKHYWRWRDKLER